MIIFVLLFICFVLFVLYLCIPKVHGHVFDVNDVEFQTGDLLLVSTHYPLSHPKFFSTHLHRLFCFTEWSHVALIIVYNDIPYVLDCCPYNIENSQYDWSSNKNMDAGFVTLEKYIRELPGYVAFRQLKKPIINDSTFKRVAETYEHHIDFDRDFTHRMINAWFNTKPIPSNFFYCVCTEFVAAIYQDSNVLSHPDWYQGMTLSHFVKKENDTHGSIVHMVPGTKCPSIIKSLINTKSHQ